MAVAEVSLSKGIEVSKARYAVIIVSSLLIMMCAGSTYAWSIFVAPLKSNYGLTTAETQMVYGFTLAIVGIGLVLMHHVYRKYGPRITASAGAVLFFAGYMIASFSNGNVVTLILGISIIAGFGMSMGYITVLSTLVQWLPKNRGLAAGLSVAGFGGGAVLMTLISTPFLNRGVDVLSIFRIDAIVCGLIFLIGALFMSLPPWAEPDVNDSNHRVNYRMLFRDRRFWILFYTAFAASFGGLMFYGNAKPLGISFGVTAGVALISVIFMSAGNAVGRLTWGIISDAIGPRKAIITSLLLVTAMLLIMLFGIRNDFSFLVLVLVFGFCFGADQVLYASNVANEWSIHKLNVIYPLVFLGYSVSAAIAPTLGGKLFDMTNSYSLPMIVSAAVCLSGLPIYALLMPKKEKSEKSKLAL